MKIHHIGYLVDNIQGAVCEFGKLGFTKSSEILLDLDREILFGFLDNNGHMVELIQPIDENSPIYGLRKKYKNAPYHICYLTEDILESIDNLGKNGFTLIQPPALVKSLEGLPLVAFMMNIDIGMVELLERGSDKC